MAHWTDDFWMIPGKAIHLCNDEVTMHERMREM
jgi:hypothetical protein